MPTPQPPVDETVKLPASVAAAGARADAIHKQAYANPNPGDQPAPQPAPAADAPVPPAPQPAPPPAQSQPAPQPDPQPAPQPAPSGDMYPDKTATLTAEQWKHQYLSMKGRYEQSTQSIGVLQEQLTELGDELMRTQQARPQRANPTQQRQPAPAPLVTDEEIKTYGPELIDVIQRAARQAVMPDLQNVHNGVQQVNERVQQVSTGNLYTDLDRAVSDWRAINVSDRFKAWCGLRDVYSGQVRGKMLNAAFQAADAPRVIAFFKGFLNEEQTTGQLPDPSGQPQPPAAARTPAMTLESLTAPGRAHPAGGDQPLPADKPIFTRAQIAAFYRAVRENQFVGREADKNTTEQAIFAAQRDGRVR